MTKEQRLHVAKTHMMDTYYTWTLLTRFPEVASVNYRERLGAARDEMETARTRYLVELSK